MLLKALIHIKHDGKQYSPGEQCEVARQEAERLLALRAAVVLNTDIPKGEELQPTEEKAKTAIEEVNTDEEMEKRIAMEEEYRALGGRPQPEWPIEKLQAKLEERRAE